MRYRIIINPKEYDDSEDRGYSTVVEAASEDEAKEFAIAECEDCNDWDEGYIDREACVLWDCEPDYKHFIEQACAYAAALDALELPPNGDDFNALLALINGGAYTPPTAGGR